MADFNDLLKKKSIKTDNENNKDNSDMKERMRNVLNASKKLSDGDENTISNQKQDDIKARLAKAMEASKQVEEMYAEEFDKDEEKRKEAEKEERKKKLEEQQQKAVAKLAQIEKADEEDNITKIEEPKVKKDLSVLTKKENKESNDNEVNDVKEVTKEVIKEVPVEVIKEVPVEVVKEVIKEVPVEVIKEVIKEVPVEVIKEVPVEVIKYVYADSNNKETLNEAFEGGESESIKSEENSIENSIETNNEEVVTDPFNGEESEEQIVETKSKDDNKKDKKPNVVLNFFINTMNGMAYGLFATLIIGTIISTIANIEFIKNVSFLYNFLTELATILKNLMGVGIGVGIAYNMGFKDLKLISLGLAGGIASYMCGESLDFFNFENCGIKVGDPLTVYVTVALVGLAVKYVFVKKTSIDIIIVPLFAGIIAGLISFASSPAIVFVTTGIGKYIEIATEYQPLLMGIVIAVVMGMCLTAPISSAAIASMVLANAPLAGGAAAIGCCVQMLGFAVQSARDNKIGSVVSIAIGTSMLEFKNILKKPIIWLPTIIVSAILGPIGTCLLETKCVGVSAGMGTSGLVGLIGTFDAMKDGGLNMIMSIAILEIVAPIVLVFLVDLLFRKLKLIKKGDFEL